MSSLFRISTVTPAKVSNKDKQNFNNMLIGFGGMLLAGYMEGNRKRANSLELKILFTNL